MEFSRPVFLKYTFPKMIEQPDLVNGRESLLVTTKRRFFLLNLRYIFFSAYQRQNHTPKACIKHGQEESYARAVCYLNPAVIGHSNVNTSTSTVSASRISYSINQLPPCSRNCLNVLNARTNAGYRY